MAISERTAAYRNRQPDFCIGQRFGRLIVLEPDPSATRVYGRKHVYSVKCVCDCGNRTTHMLHSLKAGRTRSCGCDRERSKRLARERIIHGGARQGANRMPEFETWQGIKKRCLNPNARNWPFYGGRGITVCERWMHDFPAFLADMGHKPTPQHSIDRIDNNGNYEPSNCRWATMKEQCANRRPKRKRGAAS